MKPVLVKSVGGYQGAGVGPLCIVKQASHSYPSHSILCVKNWATAVELLHHLCPAVFSSLWHFLEKVKSMDVTLLQAGQSRD
jgi:hypothetical protein